MSRRILGIVAPALAVGVIFSTADAFAIPAFARKYGTSCVTCHTIYPKLTPFGEAFRRNGFRFPGKDSEYIKQEVVLLGQDAYKQVFPKSVWPGVLPESVPIAVGFNGQAVLHPDTGSSAGQADNRAMFTANDLVAEGHLWAGGSFDSDAKLNFFGEITFSKDGTIDIEHAKILWNDVFGPPHLVNIIVGRGFSTLSSFGPHSSYVADTFMAPLGVTNLFGAAEGWNVMGQYNGIEVNGIAGGRFIYSVGVNAGDNHDVRPTENVYGHVGFKVGGSRLDGENAIAPTDPEKPWAETALTVDAFAYRAASHALYAITDDKGNAVNAAQDNTSYAVGGSLRFTVGSFELDSGLYEEVHDRAQTPTAVATADPMNPMITLGKGVTAISHWDEISYIVYPWFVPAIRLEMSHLSLDGIPAGMPSTMDDVRIMPGLAFLVRPNLKVTVVAQIEMFDGTNMPVGGWGAANGAGAPSTAKSVTEIESITTGMAFAF